MFKIIFYFPILGYFIYLWKDPLYDGYECFGYTLIFSIFWFFTLVSIMTCEKIIDKDI